jgi:hypothetical protein
VGRVVHFIIGFTLRISSRLACNRVTRVKETVTDKHSSLLALTNTLTYDGLKLITAVKMFMVHATGFYEDVT